MTKHTDNKSSDNEKMDEFFQSVPEELFKKMQKAIENYDKKSESMVNDGDLSAEAFTTEMLIELSKKLAAEKKRKK